MGFTGLTVLRPFKKIAVRDTIHEKKIEVIVIVPLFDIAKL